MRGARLRVARLQVVQRARLVAWLLPAVVASEPASRAGLDVLAAVGNAMDAAITVTFVLAAVYPEAGNLGGGGFALVRGPDGTRAAFDFLETAPAAAARDIYSPAQ